MKLYLTRKNNQKNKMKKNLPNILLLIRIALVPIIIILLIIPIYNNNFAYTTNKNLGMAWTDLAAGLVFIFCSFTDWLDGWWARKYNQVTTFGKFFDPLADKILVNTVLIIFFIKRDSSDCVYSFIYCKRYLSGWIKNDAFNKKRCSSST